MQPARPNIFHAWIFLRGVLTLIWLHVSIGIYSILCLLSVGFSRKLAYAFGKLWSSQLLAVAGARIQVRGLENIQSGCRYTVLSNHQSQLDILTLMSVTPLYLYFVAKKELFDIPFFGWGIRALGHIPIDRKHTRRALEAYTRAARQVRSQAHMSLVLFPEGTRSEDGNLGSFKQGSFTLVLEAGLPVIPVAIQGSRAILPKGSLMAKPGRITITYGNPIDITRYTATEKALLSQQVRENIEQLLKEGN